MAVPDSAAWRSGCQSSRDWRLSGAPPRRIGLDCSGVVAKWRGVRHSRHLRQGPLLESRSENRLAPFDFQPRVSSLTEKFRERRPPPSRRPRKISQKKIAEAGHVRGSHRPGWTLRTIAVIPRAHHGRVRALLASDPLSSDQLSLINSTLTTKDVRRCTRLDHVVVCGCDRSQRSAVFVRSLIGTSFASDADVE